MLRHKSHSQEKRASQAAWQIHEHQGRADMAGELQAVRSFRERAFN